MRRCPLLSKHIERREKTPPPLQVKNLEEIAKYLASGRKTDHQAVIAQFKKDGYPESYIQQYIEKRCKDDVVYVLYDNKEILEIFQTCLAFPACFQTGQKQVGRTVKTIYTGLIPSELAAIMQSLGYQSKIYLFGVAQLANHYLKYNND